MSLFSLLQYLCLSFIASYSYASKAGHHSAELQDSILSLEARPYAELLLLAAVI